MRYTGYTSMVMTILVIVLSLTGAPALAAKETFHQTYEAAPGTYLDVRNYDGSIEITQGKGTQVDVHAEKIPRFGGSLKNVEIVVETTGSTMKIETKRLVGNPRVTVNYTITVPEGILVREVTSSDGSLKLIGIQGDLQAKTSDGSIRLQRVQGPVDAKTSDGSIDIDHVQGRMNAKTSDGSISGENITGEVDAKTSDGSITLKDVTGNVTARTSDGSVTVKNVRGDVAARTSDGSIQLDHIEGYVHAETSDGSIKAQDVAGISGLETSNGNIHADVREVRHNATISTSDGSISLSLAPNLNADMNMRTKDGKIVLHDMEIRAQEISQTTLKGILGNGGHSLTVKTSDGNIDVHALP